jgi:hypothetical protein
MKFISAVISLFALATVSSAVALDVISLESSKPLVADSS